MDKSLNKVIYNWLIFILLLVSVIFGGRSFLTLASQSDNVIKVFSVIFIGFFSIMSLFMLFRSISVTLKHFKGVK